MSLPFASRSLRCGLGDKQAAEREHEAGTAADVERGAPAPARFDEAADHVAERRADRNREIEDRERAALVLGRREVIDDRRRERRVARLADADERRAPAIIIANVSAKPDAIVATLHTATPSAMRPLRAPLSARAPKSGDVTK